MADLEPLTPHAVTVRARRAVREQHESEPTLTRWQAEALDAYLWSEEYGRAGRPRAYTNPLDGPLDTWTANLRGGAL